MTTLLPYQHVSAAFLAQRDRAILADAPRVGKTYPTIAALDYRGARKVLWLTKGAARSDHAAAFRKIQMYPRNVRALFDGDGRPGPDVTITSYDLAAGALFDRLMDEQYDALVCDEFHRLKNQKTKRTVATFGKRAKGEDCLLSRADIAYFLSGTPAPNYSNELFPVLRAAFSDAIIARSGKPMDYFQFEKRYCQLKSNGFGHKVVGNRNTPELKEKLKAILLRRTLAEVAPDMPPIRFSELVLGDTGALAELRALEKEALLEGFAEALAKARSDDARMAILNSVDQSVARRLRRLTGMAKASAIVDVVKEELEDNDEKIVLFAWHREPMDLLVDGLAAFNPVLIAGGSTPAQKDAAKKAFMEDPARRVAVCQIEAAGEAIDLSSSDNIIFVEADWVPGNNAQAALRCTNVMKPRPVSVRFAMLEDSKADQATQAVLMRKTEASDQLWN